MNCAVYDGVISPHWMCFTYDHQCYDSIEISIIVLIVLCLNLHTRACKL